jgi:hypothetical protein
MAFTPPKLAKKKLDRTVSKVNTKTVDVTKYDLNQIQGIATSAFQAALGRVPTARELNDFVNSVNAFAKAHPATSTGVDSSHSRTTTNIASQLPGNATTGAAPQALDTGTSTTGGRTSTSTSTGGVDLSNFATQYAQGISGFGNYQKSTTYFDSMLSALKGPVGGSI